MSRSGAELVPFWARRRFVLPLIALLLVNVVVYLVLTTRLANKQERLARVHAELSRELSSKQQALAEVEARHQRLTSNEEVANHFWSETVRPLDPGLTEAMAEIDRLARQSGVRRGRTAYHHEDLDIGLARVRAVFPVEGSYFNLVRFLNRLERAPVFFLVDKIQLDRGTLQDENRLELSCEVTFFLHPAGVEREEAS